MRTSASVDLVNSELIAQLSRTADRLRALSAAQLERDGRIEIARGIVATMATRVRPQVRVPELAPSAIGDQLAVVGREFVAIANEIEAEEMANQLREFRLSL